MEWTVVMTRMLVTVFVCLSVDFDREWVKAWFIHMKEPMTIGSLAHWLRWEVEGLCLYINVFAFWDLSNWDNYALNIGSSRMVYSVLFWAYRPTCLGPYWRSRNRRNFGLYYRLWVSDPKKRKNGLFDGFSVDKLRRTKNESLLAVLLMFLDSHRTWWSPNGLYLSIRLKMLKPIGVEINLVGQEWFRLALPILATDCWPK